MLIQNPCYSHIAGWGPHGSGLIIHDELLFESEILPKYFKHSNINSFVRQVPNRLIQLNMYHFVKSKCNGFRNEFENKYFLRDNRYSLPKLCRSMLQFVRRKP